MASQPVAKPRKPQPIEVKSDDLEVTIGGKVYTPHAGECVWLIPGLSVGALHALNGLTQIGTQLEAAQGEPDEGIRTTRLMDQSMQALLAALAPRIVRWTWTDLRGEPMAQPDGTVERLQDLEAEELYWLLAAVKGETPSQAKND